MNLKGKQNQNYNGRQNETQNTKMHHENFHVFWSSGQV